MIKRLISSGLSVYGAPAYAFLRAFYGLALVYHGWDKIRAFDLYASDFPDPLGLGAQSSLILAIFAEFICGLLVAIGLWTRLAAIPIVSTFLIAFFVVHAQDPFQEKELALIYLVIAIYCLLKGSGSCSVDKILYRLRYENL